MFFGLKVPEGPGRHCVYKSKYRAIYTYKLSAAQLDQAFKLAVTGEGADGGWSINLDERIMYAGKLAVQRDETCLKVTTSLPTRSCARPLLLIACSLLMIECMHGVYPPQVTMEDHPEAGMSALKYFTFQSFEK